MALLKTKNDNLDKAFNELKKQHEDLMANNSKEFDKLYKAHELKLQKEKAIKISLETSLKKVSSERDKFKGQFGIIS